MLSFAYFYYDSSLRLLLWIIMIKD